MPRQSVIDSFERAVASHFTNPPDTWVIVKISDRNWGIALADGLTNPIDRFTTKREAEHALESGEHAYRRIWEGHDRWYRGNGDHRDRPLERWEQDIIAQYI